MGHGSYRASDWVKLKESRGINTVSAPKDIFQKNEFQDKYDPRFISVRESRDSADSPNATPVILAFDVTGSMGYLAAEIAKNSLNKTVLELYDKRPITDPHVMCAAITSAYSARALQVTQFEADIRVVEQLLELVVGFGGNKYSYDSLIWYFAAKHTSIDCYEKRAEKGFLFTIGDEVCGYAAGETLSSEEIRMVFKDEVHGKGLSLKEVYEMAAEKYEIFHIVVGRSGSVDSWKAFLPGRVANLSAANVGYLSEVITSIMQITKGMPKEEAIEQWPEATRAVVAEALENIGKKTKTANTEKQSFFGRIFGK